MFWVENSLKVFSLDLRAMVHNLSWNNTTNSRNVVYVLKTSFTSQQRHMGVLKTNEHLIENRMQYQHNLQKGVPLGHLSIKSHPHAILNWI